MLKTGDFSNGNKLYVVKILWNDVDKKDSLILQQWRKKIYQQIHMPNNNRPLN
jgi:hypothetical protein